MAGGGNYHNLILVEVLVGCNLDTNRETLYTQIKIGADRTLDPDHLCNVLATVVTVVSVFVHCNELVSMVHYTA